MKQDYNHSRLLAMIGGGCIEEVRELLHCQDIDVNYYHKEGYQRRITALMWAAFNNEKEIVEMLLSHPNINLNITDPVGNTAIDYSKVRPSHRAEEITKILEKSQANERAKVFNK